MLLSLKMCYLETAESLLLQISDRNSHRVPTTVHSWNHSWNTNHYGSFLLFIFSSSSSSALIPPPSFFPTGLWAPLVALLVPSSPPPWRGGGHWSGAWVGATILHHHHRSGTAGTSTRCPWWCATSWSPATSVWFYWPHLHWALLCSCSSTTVRWFKLYTQLYYCTLRFLLYCIFMTPKCMGHCLAIECL